MKGLTPGRIVHYVAQDGEHCPAIVTGTYDGDVLDQGVVYLTVFSVRHSPMPTPTAVVYDEAGKAPGTWHWIGPDDQEGGVADVVAHGGSHPGVQPANE